MTLLLRGDCMAPNKPKDETTMVSLRFPNVLLEKIDRYTKVFEKENPGLKITRAVAIRMLVTKGLEKGDSLE